MSYVREAKQGLPGFFLTWQGFELYGALFSHLWLDYTTGCRNHTVTTARKETLMKAKPIEQVKFEDAYIEIP